MLYDFDILSSKCTFYDCVLQAGRAGRRQGASLAIILGRERPFDVFYMKNPKKVITLLHLKFTHHLSLEIEKKKIEMEDIKDVEMSRSHSMMNLVKGNIDYWTYLVCCGGSYLRETWSMHFVIPAILKCYACSFLVLLESFHWKVCV